MKPEGKKFNLLLIAIISIFFICLFTFPSLATSSLPGDFVGPMGDPTPDGKVDFNDLMVFATAYGSVTGDPNWNDICDICGYLGDPTPDGKVNFDDLMLFATNYGKVDYEHYLQIGNEAIEEVVALTEQYGKTQAYQMIVDYLLEKEGIIDAGVTPDGECVWYELDDGFTFSFSEYPEEEELSPGETSLDKTQSFIRNLSRATPDNNKAIILDREFELDNTPNTVRNYLEDAYYFVDYNPRSAFTLEKVMDLCRYGVVYICSHAFSGDKKGIKIVTGEESTQQTSHYYRQKYGDDVVNKTTGVHTLYKITIGGVGFINLGPYLCFYPDFIRDFAKNAYPDSLIYADVCHGYDDLTMAKAFDDVGAYVYCSYIGTTRVGCQHDKNVFKWLTIDHLNIEEAISNCADSWLCGSLRYYPEDHGDFYLVNGGTGPVHNLTKDTYYTTIQVALNNADNNNTIEVYNGTYDESIYFPSGKKIILQSVNGPSSTIIRGNDGSDTVYLNSSLEGTILEGFTITHANGYTGRGIFNYNGNLTINNCTISDNSTEDWGGGIRNYGTLTITESTVSDNSSTHHVGGIFNDSVSTLTIIGSTISGNSADGTGGGILNYYVSTLTIIGSTISGNTSNAGGGIYNGQSGTLTIIGSTISGNTSNAGGGIWNNKNIILTIDGSTISSNSADYGGGIYIYSNGTLTITRSTISSNSADYGGGIYKGESSPFTLTITGSTISGNSADGAGGGILIIYPTSGTTTIGGSSNTDTGNFNEFINNYKTGNSPSPDQHIRDSNGDCHTDYPYNYFTPDY